MSFLHDKYEYKGRWFEVKNIYADDIVSQDERPEHGFGIADLMKEQKESVRYKQ